MDIKQQLQKAKWNTFQTYPKQGTSIYLKLMMTVNGTDEKRAIYTKLNSFNAVSFNIDKFRGKYPESKWDVEWVYVDEIEGVN